MWVDNIRMDLREMGWGDVDWVGLVQDRNRGRALVNSVLNLWVPYCIYTLPNLNSIYKTGWKESRRKVDKILYIKQICPLFESARLYG
jgi:hypothetical protein